MRGLHFGTTAPVDQTKTRERTSVGISGANRGLKCLVTKFARDSHFHNRPLENVQRLFKAGRGAMMIFFKLSQLGSEAGF
jgi:hypothetical protein